MGLNIVALIWGGVEAILFFIAPDVWISVVAVYRGTRAGLEACKWAAAGALVGGAIMYQWAHADAVAVFALLQRLPGIDAGVIAGVRDSLESSGLVAMLAGTFSGVPYKIYAALSGDIGLNFFYFLGLSLPARLLRFALIAGIVGGINHRYGRTLTRTRAVLTVLGLWAVFYGFYFTLAPG